MNETPLTAFIVVIGQDGSANLMLEFPEADIQRPATLRDARRALLEVSADLAAQASAQYVLASLPQVDPSPSERVAEALSNREQ